MRESKGVELIEFVWARCIDGYRVFKKEPPDPAEEAEYRRRGIVNLDPFPESDYITEKSRRTERYLPLENVVFKIFADWEPTPEGMVSFCDAYGPLYNWQEGHSIITPIEAMLREQEALRRALIMFESRDPTELIAALDLGRAGRCAFRLWQTDEGSLSPIIVPGSLAQAMWLQLALHAASGARLLSCERCGNPFLVGIGTNRRNTAKYCSNACKVAAYKARKQV
jgi:hypothetical protein